MPLVMETRGAAEFMRHVKELFGVGRTRLVDNQDAFSVFLDTGGHTNVMVGRYCKHTMKGVVMDRRSRDEPASDLPNARAGSVSPSRRERDAGEASTSYQRGKDSAPSIL